MSYNDFAQSYLEWLNNQLEYVNGGVYSNFYLSIDPTYEVTAFKQSIDVNQQNVFHNAADDQVSIKRQINEIDKTPLDYLNEYEEYLQYEINLIQSNIQSVENTHKSQEASNKNVINFYASFAPKVLTSFAKYNPTRIF